MDYSFSVSICVYNGDNAEHFDLALYSIFNQTLMPDEVVLVVDGPVNDLLNAVIDKYEKKYGSFKVVRSKCNVGQGNARRLGLDRCSNELIALMDADDISVSKRFEKQINVFKNRPETDIVGGLIKEFVGDTSNIIGQRTVPENNVDIYEYMKKRCPMNQVTVMLKKSAANDAGGYIDWHYEEDYYLWIRMMQKDKKFYNLQENLVYVRVGKEMYKRRGGIKYFTSEEKLQRYMLKNKIISLPCYIINVVERFILQVIMTDTLRGWFFKRFARE